MLFQEAGSKKILFSIGKQALKVELKSITFVNP
jgi:hypothetical protein